MSDKTSPGLPRKANGPSAHEPAKLKSGDGGSSRTARGRSHREKHRESTKTNDSATTTTKPPRQRTQQQGEKLVVRRLPPSMTEAEFASILGTDWQVGNGSVDWFSYVPGKISTDPSKPSRPSRAYIHVLKRDSILPLSDVVRVAKWEDAKGTFTNPSLIAPPSLEISLYRKVPSNKKRSDARQGTIDQDPEFMAFLEELANPMPARDGLDAEDGDDATKADGKIATTPLIEFLREKKANRAKEAAAAKSAKHSRQDGAAAKGKSTKDDDLSRRKGKENRAEKSDKASKETVRILTKKAATDQAAEAAKAVAAQVISATASDTTKTRRAGIAAAARILQRDLGLSPGSAHRKARQDAAKADPDPKDIPLKDGVSATAAQVEEPASPAPVNPETAHPSKFSPATSSSSKSQASGRRGRGGKGSEKSKAGDAAASPTVISAANPPTIMKKKAEPAAPSAAVSEASETASTSAPKPALSKSTPSVASSSTKPAISKVSAQKKPVSATSDAARAFVKHVNTSQGITEAALRQSLEVFGPITSVDLDKRKSFAYVDFQDREGLVKAMSASPITVGQGSVQVVERKEKKPGSASAGAVASNGGGSGGASAGGSMTTDKGSGRGRRGRGGGGGGKTNAATATTAAPSSGTG